MRRGHGELRKAIVITLSILLFFWAIMLSEIHGLSGFLSFLCAGDYSDQRLNDGACLRSWLNLMSGWVVGIGALVVAARQLAVMAQQSKTIERQASQMELQSELAFQKQKMSELRDENSFIESAHQFLRDLSADSIEGISYRNFTTFFYQAEDQWKHDIKTMLGNETALPADTRREILNECISFDYREMHRLSNELKKGKSKLSDRNPEAKKQFKQHCLDVGKEFFEEMRSCSIKKLRDRHFRNLKHITDIKTSIESFSSSQMTL